MEASLVGLDLVINCRTNDVAHNAAMASTAGHPVWIEAMKAAMAVVERLKPAVSGDPLTATGPVLMSKTVQQYFGLNTTQFCNKVHVKDGLVFKAYPKGQWFTPCWPWFNLKCYKKLETEDKFLVRSDPTLSSVVGVHHYSGTWTGQSTNAKGQRRKDDWLLAARSTVNFFWNSPHFVEFNCSGMVAAHRDISISNHSNSSSRGSSSGKGLALTTVPLQEQQQLSHTRPVKAAQVTTGAVRKMLGLLQQTAEAVQVARLVSSSCSDSNNMGALL